MMKYAVIVAGGSGMRFNSEIPKQFTLLNGKPILMHTVEAFINFCADIEIILVLPESQISYWENLCKQYNFTPSLKVVTGGDSRFKSVKNALDTIPFSDALVAIHDGVRPMVTKEMIAESFRLAEEKGSAIPVVSLNDSVRYLDDDENTHSLDRNKLRAVQTPQTFQVNLLKEAYEVGFRSEFTDDASVVEYSGKKVSIYSGDFRNIKITRPIDSVIAQYYIDNE